jgi:hypothetical protein
MAEGSKTNNIFDKYTVQMILIHLVSGILNDRDLSKNDHGQMPQVSKIISMKDFSYKILALCKRYWNISGNFYIKQLLKCLRFSA